MYTLKPLDNLQLLKTYLIFVAAFEDPPLSELTRATDFIAELGAAMPLPAAPLALEQAHGRL